MTDDRFVLGGTLAEPILYPDEGVDLWAVRGDRRWRRVCRSAAELADLYVSLAAVADDADGWEPIPAEAP